MLSQYEMDALKQIAKGIAGHFGSSCEVVIHELSERSADSSIVRTSGSTFSRIAPS